LGVELDKGNETAILRISCRHCRRQTRQVFLTKKEAPVFGEWQEYFETYSILECQGCESLSFLIESTDYSSPIEDDDGVLMATRNIEQYPRASIGTEPLHGIWCLPELVRKIYTESVTAYLEGANVLASVGFRATIEAVCTDQKTPGRTLEDRISRLAKNGVITDRESKLLHAIRFLGNDAAHEIRAPKNYELTATLRIIQHLLATLYTLDRLTHLPDRVIDNYESFEALVTDQLRQKKKDDVLTSSEIVGKHMRRVLDGYAQFEHQLIERIKRKEYPHLEIEREMDDSGRVLRQFRVLSLPEPELNF
jgi:hypothetical protein